MNKTHTNMQNAPQHHPTASNQDSLSSEALPAKEAGLRTGTSEPLLAKEDEPRTQDSGSRTHYNHRRSSRIAKLPKTVRDDINQKLLDGVPYAKIIESLGENAKDINEDVMYRWKAGGYEDWLRELDCKEALCSSRDYARDLLKEKAGLPVQDASRTIASGQIFDLLLGFHPRTLTPALAAKPELYFRLLTALARLTEGEATSGHRRALQALLEAKLREVEPAAADPKTATTNNLKEISRRMHLL
jgi:hypothetical protein